MKGSEEGDYQVSITTFDSAVEKHEYQEYLFTCVVLILPRETSE